MIYHSFMSLMSYLNKIMLAGFIFVVLLQHLHANNITGNIGTVTVTANKNYSVALPTWLTSPFMRANNEAVISTYTGSSQYPFASYTFTYSSPLPGTPNLAYGITRYRGNDYLGQEFWEIRQTGRTATTFSVEIQIFGVTNLWILSVAYLAVDPTFPHHLNSFDNVPINYTAGNIVNISTKTSSLTYYVNTINYTAQAAGKQFTQFTTPYSSNYVVIFMTSLWIQGSFGTLVQFHVTPEIVNNTHYRWNITMFKSCLVTNVHFSEIIFNSDDVQSSKKYFIVFQKWYNDIDGGFLEIPIAFVDNFIMGVTAFQCTDAACGFEYQWEFANKTVNGETQFGVEMLRSWSLKNRCGFSWSESYLFYMMTWQCDPPYHYFNLSTGYCQTACGGWHIQNITDYTCSMCTNSDCYQCEGSIDLCSDCALYLNYELQGGNCVCMARHLHTNDSCQHCSYGSTGCTHCTYDDGGNGLLAYNAALFTCLECNNTENYFLVAGACTLCSLSNCIFCENLTACGVCDTGYDYSDQQTCLLCQVTGCTNCSATNVNQCVVCNATLGYYYAPATKGCDSLCGDGILVSADEACDDGNVADFDGCSSTCTVEASFTCAGEPADCSFEPSVALSIDSQALETVVCNTITFGVRITPPSDTFAQPFIVWDDFLSSPNASVLQLNASMFSYAAGVLSVSYFLLAHLQNETLVFESNFSALVANSSLFNQTTTPPLAFTVSTSPQEALMICCDGYYLESNPVRCQEICGDGVLYELPCDDGNLVDSDGCDRNCSIEEDYACMNGSTTTPSICSYNGTFSLVVDTGIKDPGSNSLTLTYIIYPTIPLLSLNNGSTDFASMVSFPGSEGVVLVRSAYLDPDTGKLVVDVGYTETIQDSDIEMKITPPDVPQAALLPNITKTWTVDPDNQLAAIYYSDEDYATADKIKKLADALQAISLAIVLLAVVSRKFIGLEHIALLQLGYLSLLQNKEITTYLQPEASWGAIFGYNEFYLSPYPQERFQSPYGLFGYQEHFGFSNNMMVLAAAASYFVAGLLLLGSLLTSKSLSRKFRNGAFLVANELSYTIVVFNTPNMVTALCLEAQAGTILNTDLVWSKGMMIGSVMMLLTSHLLNLSTAYENHDVGTYFRKHSAMGVYMPIIFSIRLIALTTLLFAYHLSPSLPSYLIIIIQFGYIAFIAFGRPHKKGFDLFRACCVELGLLYIFVVRFTETKVIAEYVNPDSIVYPVIAYLQYGFYGLASTVSMMSLVYHLVKRLKGKKVGDKGDKDEGSKQKHEKLSNDSLGKVDSPPNKPKVDHNPLIFDIDDVDVEVPQTSVMSLDPQKSPSRKRRTGSRRR